jgi:glycerol uptake facilitator protein
MERPLGKPDPLAGIAGECLAEFMGTMVLVLFGVGAMATFALFTHIGLGNTSTPFAYQWIVPALGWGLAYMLGIYVAGTISGAHINPAVTLALAARRRFPWSRVLPYWVSQLVGAFIAAIILFLVYRGPIDHYIVSNTLGGVPLRDTLNSVGTVFYTYRLPFVGVFGAFCTEFIATALLVSLIFALVDVRNQPVQGNLNPLIIGLLVAAIGLALGVNTGFALNPARDFGPRLWMAMVYGGRSFANDYWWIPIIACLLGGVVGALIYDFTIGRTLIARHEGLSGDTITRGQTVREPAT